MESNQTFPEPYLEKQLKGHRNGITSIFYSPNDHQIATSSLDNSVMLWDFRGNMRSYKFEGHDEAVMDVTFSPSGKYMASASRDKTVRLWVPTVTGSTGMFKAHSQTVRSVQFTSDASKIITASDDKIVKLWSSDKFKFISSFVGHTNWVRCARICSDGSVIASCSDDKSTRLWNPDSGECIHTYKDQKGHGVYLAWHPSGCYIAVGTSHGNVKLYDIRTHNLVQYYSIHNDAVSQVAFHPSGSYILTASKDSKMKILDLLEGHPIFTLSGHTGAVNAVNFSPSGKSFASAGNDKLVMLWKTNFTELANDSKENFAGAVNQTPPTGSATQITKSGSAKARTQGVRLWHLCYHSTKYPVATFVHLDDNEIEETDNTLSFQDLPNANSTLTDTYWHNQNNSNSRYHSSPLRSQSNSPSPNTTNSNQTYILHKPNARHISTVNTSQADTSYSVGHISHIPRTPPRPTTYNIPSIMSKSLQSQHAEEDLFGMIKLKENDVCYTSGTIEWVGKKRSFPINSGFKIINENHMQDRSGHEPTLKKAKRFDSIDINEAKTTHGENNMKECDCADVLPTVNAIIDHLNALHEAVDIVDLRLTTIEDLTSKNM